MDKYDYDLFVIGAGSGGVRAARIAAGFGARVALAEDRYMGGTCVNVGCVPKKLYVYASEFGKGFQDAREFGWDSGTPDFNWATLRDNKKTEISRLNAIYRNLLAGVEAQIIDGRGRIIDAHTVAVGEQHYTADKILIATGGWPHVPDFPGSEYAVTSNEIFDLDAFPKRLLIVGGGYIAVEFAGIFNGIERASGRDQGTAFGPLQQFGRGCFHARCGIRQWEDNRPFYVLRNFADNLFRKCAGMPGGTNEHRRFGIADNISKCNRAGHITVPAGKIGCTLR